ncbi:MAG: AAA family ATPase, partial [Methylotenera sp.]|nr:AAA family ATPase [Methylotenera sp.]
MSQTTTSNLLTPQQLTLGISVQHLNFSDTSELITASNKSAQHQAWIAQSEAKKAAEFGLNIHQPGFNLLTLGEPGTGRTTLMLSAMHEAAIKQKSINVPVASDLVALYQFDANGKPLFLKLPAGAGTELKQALDQFIRNLAKELVSLLDEKVKQNSLAPIQTFLIAQLNIIKTHIALIAKDKMPTHYFDLLQQD